MVLWTALRLGPRAYGMEIQRVLEARTGAGVAPGAVYVTLRRLEEKGFLEATPESRDERRSGRPRRFLRVTLAGRRALRESKATLVAAWSGLETFVEGS
jgi:DNA-binding PadR family transcriptional regulator